MSSLVVDQNHAYQLRTYVIDLQEWFELWFLKPVGKALGGLIPAEMAAIRDQIVGAIVHLQGPAYPVPVGDIYLPVIKRALLLKKQQIAQRQESLRAKTPHHGVAVDIEALMTPVRPFMTQPWFKEATILPIPPLTEFLTLEAARRVLPHAVDEPQDKYDDKFGFLYSQSSYAPRLRHCRTESWLRRVEFCVAFADIDDFKTFNTKYSETRVDRDLLPRVMQTLEAHVFAHGWVFRFGGDEYVLLLPNTTATKAEDSLRELQTKVASLRFIGIDETITVSIGMCLVGYDSFVTDHEILAAANGAKQEAKRVAGKNRIAKVDLSHDGDAAVSLCEIRA